MKQLQHSQKGFAVAGRPMCMQVSMLPHIWHGS